MRKSQTATEYLIIVAVVIIIAIMVIGVLGGVPGIGGGSSKRSNSVKLMSGNIGISSYSVYDCGTKMTVRNNNPYPVVLAKMEVNNTYCADSIFPLFLAIGESSEINCPNICEDLGKKYNYDVKIYWRKNEVDAPGHVERLLGLIGTVGRALGESVVSIDPGSSSSGGTSSGSGPIHAQCGGSNGGYFYEAPNTDFCSVGTAGTVSGSGPWNWVCTGFNDGNMAYCSANYEPLNGVCGDANGGTFGYAPTENLCSVGTAGTVSGSGPWNWVCEGTIFGATDYCYADFSEIVDMYIFNEDELDIESWDVWWDDYYWDDVEGLVFTGGSGYTEDQMIWLNVPYRGDSQGEPVPPAKFYIQANYSFSGDVYFLDYSYGTWGTVYLSSGSVHTIEPYPLDLSEYYYVIYFSPGSESGSLRELAMWFNVSEQ
jgi:hypothetical protein